MKTKKIHFLNSLLEDSSIPDCYSKLNYAFNNHTFFSTPNTNATKQPGVSINIAFPTFLIPVFKNRKVLKIKKITQRNLDCFGIIIDPKLNGIDQYLQSHFSKNSRTPILRKKKRLEACFNISYKIYYGNIEKTHYDFLMLTAKRMLEKRFAQKQDTTFVLKDWNRYQNILLPLIHAKKASFFVIYNGSEPIQISINYHFGQTFFAYIPAYNIDYSSFGLGNTAIYQQLEWCINNNYTYLDMGNGDYEYKKRWCNYHSGLQTHIVYKKAALINTIIANTALYKIKSVNILKSLINSNIVAKIKTLNIKNTEQPQLLYSISQLPQNFDLNLKNTMVINLKNSHPEFNISKPVFDFLFKFKEHIDNVTVYKLDSPKSYLIKGLQNQIKIDFN